MKNCNAAGQLMPFISIIIPIFNAEKNLIQCIDSTLNQTFTDIECVCVDDGSKDGSVSIVEKYAKKDKRIRLIRHEKNMGTLKARSAGVEAATGQYIMFLDQDDEFMLNACDKMHSVTKKHKADIYSFGTEIECSNETIKRGLQKVYKSYQGYVYGLDIMRKCVIDREFTWGVWNKMFASVPCKKAHEQIGNCQVGLMMPPIGEDCLEFMAIAYFSDSLYGIVEPLYIYHYGRGFSNEKQLSLEDFERCCMSAISVENCRVFFAKQGEINNYMEIVGLLGAGFLSFCINTFLQNISVHDKEKAIRLMMKYWPHDKLAMRFGLLAFNGHARMNKMKTKTWEVPFKLLPKGGRIVLYGAGAVGHDYYRQLTDSGYCEVVLWVDRDYDAICKSGMPVSSPDEIKNVDYDKVLIAILDEVVASSIKQYLMKSFNISGEHIIGNSMSLVT